MNQVYLNKITIEKSFRICDSLVQNYIFSLYINIKEKIATIHSKIEPFKKTCVQIINKLADNLKGLNLFI